jgi:hypothetical protein
MTKILGCGRTVSGDVVAFDIQWEGDLGGGRIAWSVLVTSDDGEGRVRLAHERADGSFAGQYVADEVSGRRRPVEEDADVSAGEVTARFPANVVGVAVDWPVWQAVVEVDGEEVATHVVPVS